MHMVGPWLSTTSTKKQAKKLTKAKQQELESGWRERNARLKQIGLPKETFEQYLEWVYGRGKTTKTKTTDRSSLAPSAAKANTSNTKISSNGGQTEYDNRQKTAVSPHSLGEWITGPCSSKPSPTYTGTKIIGIGVMHKSNAVPIFSDEEAKDISRMRR